MSEKNSSYKLDFKFRLQDGMKQWSMTDFKNCRYYWYDDTSNFISPAMTDIRETFYKEKFSCDEYYYNYYSGGNGDKTQEMKEFIYTSPEWQKCEAAFQKWLKRRAGVANSWEQFVGEYNINKKTEVIKPNNLNLKTFSSYCHLKLFRNILENSRPIKIEAGSVVRLSDKYKSAYNYDPYYWDHQNGHLERIGTVLQYTGDCATTKCGLGSREVRVMWFGSGKETKISEKALEFYVTPVESEVKSEEVNQ